MWRHSTTEISNGFAIQGAIPSKRKADKTNVPSISLQFFPHYEPLRTLNKRARSGDIEWQQRKESVWF